MMHAMAQRRKDEEELKGEPRMTLMPRMRNGFDCLSFAPPRLCAFALKEKSL
jgi:hypothetical protein